MIIGYHASHEQFPPSELLALVKAAEQAGFQAAMTSDHIAPWSERQGNSGNNWAWLGAALSGTAFPFGSLAIPGGWRYHPAVLAHLVATLAEMFPSRLPWIALGSGEALNESVVGSGWPSKDERNARLRASADILRALFRGDTVTAHHPWFDVDDAKLWSLPATPPRLYGAALTPETAAWLGPWADGLITVRKPRAELRMVVESFAGNGGFGKPMALQLQVSWSENRDDARIAAWQQWRNAAAPPHLLADLRTPGDFDKLTSDFEPGEIEGVIPLVTEGRELLDMIADAQSLGFEEIYVHNVSRDQAGFMRFMSREVLPSVRKRDVKLNCSPL
jgi:coenzyme F420-dependent glucose-6-phosphate dehydrogenase